MKNYPNQASSFPRIRNTLMTISELRVRGVDVLDDDVLGYELARRGHYGFRGIDYATASAAAIELEIDRQRMKPTGVQGARTNAREIRRTLIDMKWLTTAGDLTPVGQSLLASDPDSDSERGLLAAGLLDIQASIANGPISHPVVILLRLLAHAPSNYRAGLELALEAEDDSPGELERVVTLYDQIRTMNPPARAVALGVSEATRANAVKIFPTLAKYAGLVTEDSNSTFRIAPIGQSALATIDGSTPVSSATFVPPFTPDPSGRRLTQGAQRPAMEIGAQTQRTIPAALSPARQVAAQNRLNERTNLHQYLVARFASFIGDGTGELYEDSFSFDLVWLNVGPIRSWLFEMKTIDSDADSQVMRAIGQLAYYEHFHVANQFPGVTVDRALIVDNRIPEELCELLGKLRIGVVLSVEAQPLEALNTIGQSLLDSLPTI